MSELDPEGFGGGGGFEQAVTGRKDVLRWGNSLGRGLEAGMGHVISAPWVWLGCQVRRLRAWSLGDFCGNPR